MKQTPFFSLIVITAFLLLSSCAKSKYLDPAIVFGTKEILKGEVIPEPIWAVDMTRSTVIYGANPWIITWSYLNEYILQLHDMNSGSTVYHTGNIGRGPEEMIFPFPVGTNFQDSIIYINDIYGASIHPYKISDSTLIKLDVIRSQYLFALRSFYKMSDSTYFINSAANSSCMLLDTTFAVLDSIPIKPVEMNDETFHNKRIVTGFDKGIKITPDNSRIIAYYPYFPILEISEITPENKISLTKRIEFFPVSYSTIQNEFTYDPSQQLGISQMTLSSDYYYALVQDYTFGEYEKIRTIDRKPFLMIFDRDLNFIKSYQFDRILYNITISSDNKYLYSLTDDHDDEKNMYIIRYELPKL